MPVLQADDIIRAWEAGRQRAPLDRGQLVLSLAGVPAEAAAKLSVGQRNAALLEVRAATLGTCALHSAAVCPACCETLELTLDAASMLAVQSAQHDTRQLLRVAGFRVRYRLPTCGDLLAAGGCGDVESARRALIALCVMEARYGGAVVAAADLPEVVIEALADAVATQDPLADIRVRVRCGVCAHEWLPLLEVGSFVWQELAAQASLLLGEVDLLARAYGWPEADILAMHPARRQAYLEMGALG